MFMLRCEAHEIYRLIGSKDLLDNSEWRNSLYASKKSLKFDRHSEWNFPGRDLKSTSRVSGALYRRCITRLDLRRIGVALRNESNQCQFMTRGRTNRICAHEPPLFFPRQTRSTRPSYAPSKRVLSSELFFRVTRTIGARREYLLY